MHITFSFVTSFFSLIFFFFFSFFFLIFFALGQFAQWHAPSHCCETALSVCLPACLPAAAGREQVDAYGCTWLIVVSALTLKNACFQVVLPTFWLKHTTAVLFVFRL
jgi:hypothetical protein